MTAAAAARARARALPAAPAAAMLLVAGWLATFALWPWADERVNDLLVYRSYAELFLDGLLPYRDVAFEYPPLASPALALAGLAGAGAETYRLAFGALMLAPALAALLLTGRLARVTGGDERLALAALAALPLLAGAMVRTHFDLVPVAIALGALAAILHRRVALGFALIGAGAMTKAFPLVLAPIALAWLAGGGGREAGTAAGPAGGGGREAGTGGRWGRTGRREALRGAAALAVTLAALGGAWLAVSPDGAREAVAYHLERPLQVESAPAAVLYAADALGAAAPEHVASHRSDGLLHPAAGALTIGFAAALAVLLAALTAAVVRRPGERALVLAGLTAIAALAALGKVLSPQFLIWMAPLGALALAWRERALAVAVAAATLLTFAEFPFRYFDVVDGEPAALGLVAARDATLLAAVALAVSALRREPAAAAARSTRPAPRRRRSPARR